MRIRLRSEDVADGEVIGVVFVVVRQATARQTTTNHQRRTITAA
jgi:hypothetical protein